MNEDHNRNTILLINSLRTQKSQPYTITITLIPNHSLYSAEFLPIDSRLNRKSFNVNEQKLGFWKNKKRRTTEAVRKKTPLRLSPNKFTISTYG